MSRLPSDKTLVAPVVASVLGLALHATPAEAAPGDGDAPTLSARASTDGDAEAEGPLTKREERKAKRDKQIAEEKKKPWIRRWEPTRHMVELGLYGGIFFPSTEHDLYDPATAPPDPFWVAGPEVGARAAYFPLKPLGIEAEFGADLLRQRNITNDPTFVYGFRGHAILQMPIYRIIPFLLGGYGLLGIRSPLLFNGNDIDPAFHYGGGVKMFINRWLVARLEARQIVSASATLQDSGTSHFQALAGLSVTLGRKWAEPPPKVEPVDPDRDKDGIDTVIMNGGGNDFLLGDGADCTTQACIEEVLAGIEQTLAGMYNDMQNDGISQIIFLGYYNVEDPQNAAINNLSMDYKAANYPQMGVDFVDTRAAFAGNESSYILSDEIHPTAAGSRVLADLILEELD